MLEIRKLWGGWGPTVVIEELSLEIASGETVSIVGRNGVGKSTLLELIAGRAARQAGNIHFDGVDISDAPPHTRCRAGLAYVPQTREVFRSLTVRENINIGLRPGAWTEERILDLFPSLRARLNNLGGHLSGGEQQMVAIGRALATNPKLLIMDEPTEGLAPVVIDQLVAALQKVVSEGGLTVILVEQRVDVALELSSRCLVMDRGRVTHDRPVASFDGDTDRLAELIGLVET